MKSFVLSSEVRPITLTASKRATRLSFFVAGFALAAWAPLVPYAQQRLDAHAGTLGLLLLCLGMGAVAGMPLAGVLIGRVGVRRVTLAAGAMLVCALPMLAMANTPHTLAVFLLVFGASIGAIDVAANVHGSQVQTAAGEPLMSGFHGFYSVGGLTGAAVVTGAIAAGVPVVVVASGIAVVVVCCLWHAGSGFLLGNTTGRTPLLAMPRGKVLVIGLLAFTIFLGEGAMLDWSALLLTENKGVQLGAAGSGYAVFAFAMTISRIIGDRLVSHIGETLLLVAGFLFSAVGLALAAVASDLLIVFPAIAIAGFAAGNMVPLLLSIAGRQRTVSPIHAIAATTMLGYLGVLLGPAAVGYVAHAWSLTTAFVGVAVLLALMLLFLPAISPGVKNRTACRETKAV